MSKGAQGARARSGPPHLEPPRPLPPGCLRQAVHPFCLGWQSKSRHLRPVSCILYFSPQGGIAGLRDNCQGDPPILVKRSPSVDRGDAPLIRGDRQCRCSPPMPRIPPPAWLAAHDAGPCGWPRDCLLLQWPPAQLARPQRQRFRLGDASADHRRSRKGRKGGRFISCTAAVTKPMVL